MSEKIKNLRQVMLEHVRYVLVRCQSNKTKTAKILGVSVRGLRNLIHECYEIGILKRPEEKNNIASMIYDGFPSNEQRVAYLDGCSEQYKNYMEKWESYIVKGELLYRRASA